VSKNCQDNKCKRSSQSTIIINLRVAAYEHTNVVGERFWQDLSISIPGSSSDPRAELGWFWTHAFFVITNVAVLERTRLSYQVMRIWVYIVGFHRRVKVPLVRSILYSTT
jgi:hypothetical protein